MFRAVASPGPLHARNCYQLASHPQLHKASRTGFKVRTARTATDRPIQSLNLDREKASLQSGRARSGRPRCDPSRRLCGAAALKQPCGQGCGLWDYLSKRRSGGAGRPGSRRAVSQHNSGREPSITHLPLDVLSTYNYITAVYVTCSCLVGLKALACAALLAGALEGRSEQSPR